MNKTSNLTRNNLFHIVLTRFNVKLAGMKGNKNIDPDWLAQRFSIFDDVCLAAIQGQTRPPDLWLVFFDSKTPEKFRQHLAMCRAACPQLTPIYCDEFDVAVAQRAISERLPVQADWLVTTRLDNDDAIHRNFFEVLINQVIVGKSEFLNPTQGLVIAGDRFYRKRDYSSPFISLSEPVAGFKTVLVGQHHLLHRYGPIRQFALPNAWLQIVHGGNVANQVRGVRVQAKSVDSATLPASLALRLKPVPLGELLVDNSVGLLNRYVRSAYRFLRTQINSLSIA
jgi:hypothetical protein